MKNIELAKNIIQELISTGVEEFILCAGARNSPFVKIFSANPQLKVYHFFEERSAAFFALGLIAAKRRPVAIFTTSGTAAAELLPAAVEATYSSLPLIMVTADRPKNYRGSGAPQAIEQLGIFSYYIEAAIDLDAENAHLSFKNLSWKKPVQVNVCFSEPLIDAELPKISENIPIEWVKMPEQVPMDTLDRLEEFLSQQRPLILVGYVPPRAQRVVLQFLARYQAPVYCETISGLRGHPDLHDCEIKAGDKNLQKFLDDQVCDSVLRIGGVPTIRLWRDLEDRYLELPVLSLSYNHYSGLSRESTLLNCMEALDQVQKEIKFVHRLETHQADQQSWEKMLDLIKKYPQSEPSLIHQVSRQIRGQSLYLGNSLPIREWDLVASREHLPSRAVGNRGANGIDGQISSFLGWADSRHENWAVIGDLTALYDLSAPWVVDQLHPELKLRLVIINNQGGQIFHRMFRDPLFLNSHQTRFQSFAEMWGWEYFVGREWPQDHQWGQRVMIELVPDSSQTEQFWNDLETIWKK